MLVSLGVRGGERAHGPVQVLEEEVAVELEDLPETTLYPPWTWVCNRCSMDHTDRMAKSAEGMTGC